MRDPARLLRPPAVSTGSRLDRRPGVAVDNDSLRAGDRYACAAGLVRPTPDVRDPCIACDIELEGRDREGRPVSLGSFEGVVLTSPSSTSVGSVLMLGLLRRVAGVLDTPIVADGVLDLYGLNDEPVETDR